MTLLQRIERARRQAQRGVIVPGELACLLDDVSEALQVHENRVAEVLGSLTYTEERMFRALIEALPSENGGIVVTTRLAETCQVSRTAISILIRKLRAAGILVSRSMGMKGTMVRLIGTTRSSLRQHLGGAA